MTPIAAWQDCLRAEGLFESPPHRGQSLLARWNEPHRHYHTLAHLQTCIEWWEQLRGRLQAPSRAGIALLYHDAIYDPCARNNETVSAQLARFDLIALGMTEPHIVEVEQLILATDHHQCPLHPDAAAVIDIDLAILGADQLVYDRYVAEVRLEYAHVNDHDWRTGRAQVLGHFLERNFLFSSGLLDDLEAPARRNMRNELDGLIRRN